MLIAVIVLLSVLLIASIIANIILFKAGERATLANEIYEQWITEWRAEVLKTYAHMKLLDEREIFSKDDEVGTAFTDMVNLIESLNNRTQEGE